MELTSFISAAALLPFMAFAFTGAEEEWVAEGDAVPYSVAADAPADGVSSGNESAIGNDDYGSALLTNTLKSDYILSGAWLSSTPFLWTGNETGNLHPGNAEVRPPHTGASYQRFSTILIKPLKDGLFQVGDTVDIIASLRIVRFRNKPANLVKRVGRACVRKVSGKEVQATLFDMSDVIKGRERVMPSTPPASRAIDTFLVPSTPIETGIFTRVEETASPYPYQMIILDKGNEHGVEVGDLFGIYHRENGKGPARLSMVGIIGYTGSGSATLNVVMMSKNRLSGDDRAILLRRARFSRQE